MSQEELARLIGLSNKTVSGYERSEKPLPADFLRKVSEVLQVSTEMLLKPPANEIGYILGQMASTNPSTNVTLEIFPKSILEQMLRNLAADLPEATGKRRLVILETILSMANELHSRDVEEASEGSDNPSPSSTAVALAEKAARDVEQNVKEHGSLQIIESPSGKTSSQGQPASEHPSSQQSSQVRVPK